MKILGIDPGTASCGWGVIQKDKKSKNGLKMVDYGVIRTPAKTQNSKRLLTISKELSKIVKKYLPNAAIVERLFFTRNQKTAMSVGEARGVVLLILEKNRIPISELTPLQIKSRICGYGRAEKRDVQFAVKKILGMREKPKPDDAADGLAVAICHSGYISKTRKIKK